MTRDAAQHDERASQADPAALLQRGLELLAAQRAAMVGGDPGELAAANAGLDAWLAGLSAQAGRPPGSGSRSIGHSDAARMRAALRANAAVAQRAAASTQRALAVLLPPPATRIYEADGRPSDRMPARGSIQA